MRLFLHVILFFSLYFMPAFVAALRHHHNTSAITMLTALLGWTGLGWVLALVWACTAVRKEAV